MVRLFSRVDSAVERPGTRAARPNTPACDQRRIPRDRTAADSTSRRSQQSDPAALDTRSGPQAQRACALRKDRFLSARQLLAYRRARLHPATDDAADVYRADAEGRGDDVDQLQ